MAGILNSLSRVKRGDVVMSVRDIKKREAATRYQTKVQRANDQAEQKGLSTSVESEVYDGPDFDG